VPDPGQLLLDIPGDHPVIFDDQYPHRRHRPAPPLPFP
jgi:hypothetical protein